MNLLKSLTLFALIVLLAGCALAAPLPGSQSVLVLPFENTSKQPGIGWIGEAFPELLGQRLASESLFVISRDDRQYAFDRMGIPESLHASRATLYRIAGQLDADFIILGSYGSDGQSFTARAQLLDMKNLHLYPEQAERGPLNSLIAIQSALAWDMLRQMRPEFAETRDSFLQRTPMVRLDAFEDFIRGVSAESQPDRIRLLQQALEVDLQYAAAQMLLAKTYFAQHDYEHAAPGFARIPAGDAAYSEANFRLGLCYYNLGRFEQAYAAFIITAEHVPLTEVLNNLGVVESRRGRHDASQYFEKAVKADPADADYHFNLALALYRNGDSAAAQHQLRETLSRRPSDSEARQLLEALGNPPAGRAPALPLARIKRNYDESSYRRLALELQNAIAQSIGKARPSERAALHEERGREFLANGALPEAESQFRAAVAENMDSASAIGGLARTLLMEKKFVEARRQALLSISKAPNEEAFLVLARVYLHDNSIDGALESVRRARMVNANSEEANVVEQEIKGQSAGAP